MSVSAWDYYRNFLTAGIEKQNQDLLTKPASFWEEKGAEKALAVFHAAAERVPAYKNFLEENGCNPAEITTMADFKKVPPVDKKNYLRKYPLHELAWDGKLDEQHVISVSSGSTGEPFFWPRDIWQEREVDHWYELTLRHSFDCRENRTLVLIAFAMGMYIAGPFTFASCLRIAEKGYPLAVATPSNDPQTVLRTIRNLASEYDQIIIGGYPPLVKDIIDAGNQEGINWGAKKTRLFFGGEGFSEKWRDYIHAAIGSTAELTTTVNMYGTADAALLGIETPFSVAYRRVAADSAQFREIHFHDSRLPSILTYNPLLRYFETLEDGGLVFTTSSGIPLIRYRIGDVGGVIRHSDAVRQADDAGVSLSTVLEQSDANDFHWKLPMVYLFGRHDFTVQLYGANVYPENVKEALEDKRLQKLVTGKFILTTEYTRAMTPYLKLRVELKPKVRNDRTMNKTVKKIVTEYLRGHNSEYEVIYNTIKRKAEPKVILEPHGGQDFKINIKHRWVKRKAA